MNKASFTKINRKYLNDNNATTMVTKITRGKRSSTERRPTHKELLGRNRILQGAPNKYVEQEKE